MNVVFTKKEKEEVSKAGYPGRFAGLVAILVILWVVLGVVMPEVRNEIIVRISGLVSVKDVEAEEAKVREEDSIRLVAESLGVPSGPAVRLYEFLANSSFSGVGPFRVKPTHVDWLRDEFVPGAEVNLEDPVMNANVALGLISKFHDRGYSWEQSFLIYVYGWGELAPATRSVGAVGFVDFVFGVQDE
jgi:hypothetical protein